MGLSNQSVDAAETERESEKTFVALRKQNNAAESEINSLSTFHKIKEGADHDASTKRSRDRCLGL